LGVICWRWPIRYRQEVASAWPRTFAEDWYHSRAEASYTYRVRSSLRRRNTSEIGTVERASEKQNANTPFCIRSVCTRSANFRSKTEARRKRESDLDQSQICCKIIWRTPVENPRDSTNALI